MCGCVSCKGWPNLSSAADIEAYARRRAGALSGTERTQGSATRGEERRRYLGHWRATDFAIDILKMTAVAFQEPTLEGTEGWFGLV